MDTSIPITNSSRRNIGELILLAAMCVVSWFLSQYLKAFEWVHRQTRSLDWLDEALPVAIVLAIGLAIFSLRRWHEARIEITSRLKLEEKLIHNAYYDLLTQLPNRRFFMDRLTQCVKRAQRHQDYKFAVVSMDVDQFKIVNESLGHSAGDQLILQISERLT